ncbi:VRR-NUC domain-containing protein [Marinimicrobium sp. ARAG 43.8]|uniref:VRR-NUC domain-containing protein n=1 Tax=Marinimicrobium sp. ARAG 43.8 TaxID=3418719 RepID=UPI003CE994EF
MNKPVDIQSSSQSPGQLQGPASLDDPLYYRRNFEWVLHWVRERYNDLLPEREAGFIEDVLALPEASRGLLVRLVMRKGEWFRPDSLNYPELGDLSEAAAPLLEKGWLAEEDCLSMESLFAVLTWPRLKPLLQTTFAEAGIPSSTSKAQALAMLEAEQWPDRNAREWGLEAGALWHLTVMPQCDRVRWLFFGNAYQDWSEFVLTELGLFDYEPVAFDEQIRPMHSEAELLHYWALLECRAAWEEDLSPEAILPRLPTAPTQNPWLKRHYHRLLFKLGREWERLGELTQARALYETCTYPGARGRLLRVLERQEAFDFALARAETAAQNPESDAEAQQLERLLPRLRRKLFGEKTPRSPAPDVPVTQYVLPRSDSVERSVLLHLSTPEAPVFYVENTLMVSLFGLLCWEPVFQPLPGAFFHPFQRGPADLTWPEFYARRADAFDACLASLDDGSYREKIVQVYGQKWGRQSPFVFWGALDEPLLHLALKCLPASHLKLCFQRLLRDVKANRAGFPDLIRFYPDESRYEMIEVKGPGDRLQDNQKRWLAFFVEHGMPVSVCYVTWQDGNTDD